MYFYTSASNDAPKLTNNNGDFNKLINYLIDGGDTYTCTKITPIDDNRVKIFYETDKQPFAQFQTITMSGTTNKKLDLDFFIESIDTSEKSYICYNTKVKGIAEDTSSDMKFKIKKAGFTRKFGGISDMRTVIKFKGGIEYRIDDRDYRDILNLTKNGTTDKYWKVATLSMCSSYDTLDSASGRLYPFNPNKPNLSFNPIYDSSGLFLGEAYIRHGDVSTNYYFTNGSTSYIPTYKIFANEQCIYIVLTAPNDQTYKFVTIMGNIIQNNSSVANGYLFSHGAGRDASWYNSNAAFSTTQYPYSASSNFLARTGSVTNTRQYFHSMLYDNGLGTNADITVLSESGFGSFYSGLGGMSTNTTTTNDIYFSDVLCISPWDINGGLVYYGKHPDVKWVVSNLTSSAMNDGKIYNIDGELYYQYVHAGASNTSTLTTLNLIKLQRE